MSRAFDKISAGLEDAIAFAKGDTERASLHAVVAKVDVQAIRKGQKLTQEKFAMQYGFSLGQLRDWEQHRSEPSLSDRAYLTVIAKRPDVVEEALTA
ncbi:transcriptional regulator [Caulobacter segnis]|uniref:helix-turn-helix domain-containing protein n=1 Tax=Caulobacter segnis TaxID=88688 RepID=UPI002410B08C|nr:transcriptional regulator [Caulobacter segnis]MDG2522587.1 transcriptional regulator [Caulobacter segnis]